MHSINQEKGCLDRFLIEKRDISTIFNPSLDGLPEEIQLHLFSFLLPNDLLHVGECSKRYYNLTKEKWLWKNLSLRLLGEFNGENDQLKVCDALKNAIKIEKLNLFSIADLFKKNIWTSSKLNAYQLFQKVLEEEKHPLFQAKMDEALGRMIKSFFLLKDNFDLEFSRIEFLISFGAIHQNQENNEATYISLNHMQFFLKKGNLDFLPTLLVNVEPKEIKGFYLTPEFFPIVKIMWENNFTFPNFRLLSKSRYWKELTKLCLESKKPLPPSYMARLFSKAVLKRDKKMIQYLTPHMSILKNGCQIKPNNKHE